jgi:hypothetical protein
VGFPMGLLADSTIVARKIGQSRRLVLGTPSYFEKAGEPSTPAELTDHQAVTFDLCPMKGALHLVVPKRHRGGYRHTER